MKIINRLMKYAALSIWSIPILLFIATTILLGIATKDIWVALLYSPIIVGGFITITFILDIPYLCLAGILFYMIKRKQKSSFNYYGLVLLLDILLIAGNLFLSYHCQADQLCRDSDAPLGSEQGWINGIFFGHIFWTLPLIKYLNKWFLNQTKSKEISESIETELPVPTE